MKYRVVIMVPQVIEFEHSGNRIQLRNALHALCNGMTGVDGFKPRLHTATPMEDQDAQPLPPPMAA